MMTPFDTNLVKYSAPTAPTAHEREALRVRRHARRTVVSAFLKGLVARAGRLRVVEKQPRVTSQS